MLGLQMVMRTKEEEQANCLSLHSHTAGTAGLSICQCPHPAQVGAVSWEHGCFRQPFT